jgi:hypothetical protein
MTDSPFRDAEYYRLKRREYNKRYEERHPERVKEREERNKKRKLAAASRSYYRRRDDVLQQRKICPFARIRNYRGNAEKFGRAWELTDEEAIAMFKGACAYCGALPHPLNGIDRIDSNLGYIKSNICSCCWPCNFMKGPMTKEDFLAKCQKIVEYTTTKQ